MIEGPPGGRSHPFGASQPDVRHSPSFLIRQILDLELHGAITR